MRWLINILLPGGGLILGRREWLGVSLALVFGMGANVAVAGWAIAPEAIPLSVTRSGLVAAVLSWASAQWLLWRHDRWLAERAMGLEAILKEASSALDAGDIESARASLENGAALDEESVELHVLWARTCTMQGDRSGMLAAWQRVLKLDGQRRYQAEALRGLEGRGANR